MDHTSAGTRDQVTRPAGARGAAVVVIADNSFADQERVADHFRGRCVIRFGDLSGPDQAKAATAGASAIVVTLQRLDRRVLEALDPGVRVIGRAGVGLDTIDLSAVRALGLTLLNEPGYAATEVASHAVSLMLASQRKLMVADHYVRDGWQGNANLLPLRPLDELTVGLVGGGRIGAAAARMLAPAVSRVLVYDPYADAVPWPAARAEDLDELLRSSDILSIHVPLTEDTRGMIGHRELSLLPAGAVVINTARGGIIDEDALADLLMAGRLGGAGLDVFATEPLPAGSRLLRTPNTILTPHCAALSDRSAWRLASWTVEDALARLETGDVINGNVVIDGTR
jgi:D-3-phosphoglycerate dehydrogenase